MDLDAQLCSFEIENVSYIPKHAQNLTCEIDAI